MYITRTARVGINCLVKSVLSLIALALFLQDSIGRHLPRPKKCDACGYENFNISHLCYVDQKCKAATMVDADLIVSMCSGMDRSPRSGIQPAHASLSVLQHQCFPGAIQICQGSWHANIGLPEVLPTLPRKQRLRLLNQGEPRQDCTG